MGYRKNSYKSPSESDALTEAGPKPAPARFCPADQDTFKTAARQSSPLTGGPACIRCKRNPVARRSRSRCESCLGYQAKWTKEHRDDAELYRFAHERCLDCGRAKEPGRRGLRRCLRCQAASTLRVKQMRAQRRRSGLCPRCGRWSSPGFVQCARCRSALKRYYALGRPREGA